MRVRRRKHIALPRGPAPIPAGPTERWSMDVVHDTLADGRPFWIWAVVDNWSRHSQLIEPDLTLTGTTGVAPLERVAKRTGSPPMIPVDKGSELTSQALDAWAHEHGVQLDVIRPGKPVENAVIESLTGAFETSA